jgi:hypothetical protein
VQSFPLYNPSQVDVKYWIDTEAIDALNAENYGFSVLDCLTTEVRSFSHQTCHTVAQGFVCAVRA